MPDDQEEPPEDQERGSSFTQPRSHFVDEDEEEEELNYDIQEVEEEFVSVQIYLCVYRSHYTRTLMKKTFKRWMPSDPQILESGER